MCDVGAGEVGTAIAGSLADAYDVAVVDSGVYVDLFKPVGIGVAIDPREATAEGIARFTREEYAENVAIVESARAEVFVDRPIRESVADLPVGVVIGAITRDGERVIPQGDTVVQVGDHVVVFVETGSLAAANSAL